MRLTYIEKTYFYDCIKNLNECEYVNEMKNYMQHGNTTTYSHSISVAYRSYWMCLRLPIQVDLKSLIRGALLHDFYLYDWHDKNNNVKLHGLSHPHTALINAKKHFNLNKIEEDIILNHMWPLTINKLPKFKETLIVSFVDKICCILETFEYLIKK